MTPQEAIKWLNEAEILDLTSGNTKDRQALNMAVTALEKQIPKKPKVPIDTWVCPVCGRDVEYQVMLGDNILFGGQHDYCPKCGQAIDWSDEE